MSITPRVLIVEDHKHWVDLLSERLGNLGCLCDVVDNYVDALIHLHRNTYHILFVDYQLYWSDYEVEQDTPKDNRGGDRLLETLFDSYWVGRGSNALHVFILTGASSEEDDIAQQLYSRLKKFNDYRFEDFFWKKGGDFDESFKPPGPGEKARIYEVIHAIKNPPALRFSDTHYSLEKAVHNIRIRREDYWYNEGNVDPWTDYLPHHEDNALHERIGQELTYLIHKMFSGEEQIILSPPDEEGNSATVVFRARTGYATRPTIIKIGQFKEIKAEHDNVTAYVVPYIANGANILSGYQRTQLLAGIKYNFIHEQANDRIIPFEDVFRDDFIPEDETIWQHLSDDERTDRIINRIVNIIDNLFGTTCELWYRADRANEFHKLGAYYHDSLKIDKYQSDITARIQKLATHGAITRTPQGLQFQFIEASRKDDLLSVRDETTPMTDVTEGIPERLTGQQKFYQQGIMHGDLNTQNILVENDSARTWLIDFRHTKDGHHMLRDFVQLEMSIKIFCIRPQQDDLLDYYEMEKLLLRPRSFAPMELQTLHQQYQPRKIIFRKAFEAILKIREFAHANVMAPHRDEFANYFTGLLFYHYNAIRFTNVQPPAQTASLLSTCMIYRKLMS